MSQRPLSPRLRAIEFFQCLTCLCLLVPLLVSADEASFRFAWLSDTHVGSLTGEEDLRAAVRDINATKGLKFVLVSGDVTEYGSLAQLKLAREILGELKAPCHVIPGNHDTKWSESGGTDFAKLWKADRFVFEEEGLLFIGMHEGPVMKMGDGHWAPQDVRWLESTLRRKGQKGKPLVFVTHYPVDDGIDNWFEVLDLLKEENTQVVLCGHGHANRALSFESIPGVMGRSNLRAGKEVGGYNLVEVRGGAMTFCERVTGQELKAPWHSVSLGRADYSSDPEHHPRPDFSVNTKYPGVRELWRFDSGFTMGGSPAVWQDLAICGDASGTVHALAVNSGQPRWTYKSGSAVYSTPAVEGGTVVFGSTDGNIYALAARNGKRLWRYKTERPVVACPVIAHETVFIGSSDGKFRALELGSGKLRWEFSELGGFIESRPLLFEDKVIFGAWDSHLYALDAAEGKLAWRWIGDRPGTLYSPAACWPVASEGKVFIVAPDRKMTALDAANGQQIWRTGDYVVRESIGISEDGRRFFVRAMNDFFYGFSCSAAQPEKLWETDAQFGYDINSAMLVEKDGVVFYGTKNGLLFALDSQTGQVHWQHKVGVSLLNTVLPLTGKRVLATDADGRVTLVENQQVQ